MRSDFVWRNLLDIIFLGFFVCMGFMILNKWKVVLVRIDDQCAFFEGLNG